MSGLLSGLLYRRDPDSPDFPLAEIGRAVACFRRRRDCAGLEPAVVYLHPEQAGPAVSARIEALGLALKLSRRVAPDHLWLAGRPAPRPRKGDVTMTEILSLAQLNQSLCFVDGNNAIRLAPDRERLFVLREEVLSALRAAIKAELGRAGRLRLDEIEPEEPVRLGRWELVQGEAGPMLRHNGRDYHWSLDRGGLDGSILAVEGITMLDDVLNYLTLITLQNVLAYIFDHPRLEWLDESSDETDDIQTELDEAYLYLL